MTLDNPVDDIQPQNYDVQTAGIPHDNHDSEFILNWIRLSTPRYARITGVDTDDPHTDEYTADLYDNGYDVPATLTDIKVYSLDTQESYDSPYGQQVRVTLLPDNTGLIWSQPKTSGDLVFPTSTESGRGWYSGYLVQTPTSDLDSSTDLTDAGIGGVGVSCLIFNLKETAGDSGSHMLDLTGTRKPITFPATYWYTNSDGTLVYAIHGFQTRSC